MKYLPFENITYKTRLTHAEVINKLNNMIEPEEPFRINFFSGKRTKLYEGVVYDDGFKLQRIIYSLNSFVPVITGTFITDEDCLEINVKMRLKYLVIIVIFIWMVFVTLFLFVVIQAFISNSISGNKYFALMISLLMLVLAYIMTMVGFKSESSESKNYFKRLFEAEMIEN